MKYYYKWDAEVPRGFIENCIESLTKYAVNVAHDNPSDPGIKNARITVEQLASYYGLCGSDKGSDERIERDYAKPFDIRVERAKVSGFYRALTQNDIDLGLQGLQQYIYQMYCEGENDAYMPDILRCELLIEGLIEMEDQDQSMDSPSM